MKKEFAAGWGLMLAVAVASFLLAGVWKMEGKTPIEAPVYAIILGIVLRNVRLVPKPCDGGIKAFEKILIVGIILMGARLNLKEMGGNSPKWLAVILVTMGVGFFVIYFLGKFFRLPQRLALLLSVGTTICGGSAIAITSPLVEAKEEETSYAITTIALWGLMAIIVYPLVARLLIPGMNETFGIFAGTAIHSTPQVVGAGYIFSADAGNTATAVKLVRNCFMAPVAFLVAIWYARQKATTMSRDGVKVNWLRAFPWFLFGFFVMAGLSTAGFFTKPGITHFKKAGAFLIIVGMAGIGLNTRLASFKGIGLKPFVVGLIGAVVVAGMSITMIWLTGLSGAEAQRLRSVRQEAASLSLPCARPAPAAASVSRCAGGLALR